MITWDKLFSYWAIVWFILYAFIGSIRIPNLPPFQIPSPKLALLFALIENVIEIISLITVNLNYTLIGKFLSVILIFKVLPIYILRNVPFVFPRDIYILAAVFIVYVIYLQIIGTNLLEVYLETNKSLAEGKNDTPFYRFIDWLASFFR